MLITLFSLNIPLFNIVWSYFYVSTNNYEREVIIVFELGIENISGLSHWSLYIQSSQWLSTCEEASAWL